MSRPDCYAARMHSLMQHVWRQRLWTRQLLGRIEAARESLAVMLAVSKPHGSSVAQLPFDVLKGRLYNATGLRPQITVNILLLSTVIGILSVEYCFSGKGLTCGFRG
jgi:hypothetical protein